MGFMHSFAKQVRRPEGFFGKFVGLGMNRINREGIDITIERVYLNLFGLKLLLTTNTELRVIITPPCATARRWR
jgi:hypothetical protein